MSGNFQMLIWQINRQISTYPGDHRDAHDEAKHTEAASEEDGVEFALAQDGKLVNYTGQHGLNNGELYIRRYLVYYKK